MKQLTDEVFAQVRDALKHGITRMNILGEARPCMPLHEAIAALDTAQPVQVNAMLVRALETLTNNCKGCCPSKAEIGNAALTAAQQAQPERAPLDKDTIAEIAQRMEAEDCDDSFWVEFTRAIEAHHGIKQGGQHD